MSSMVQKDGEVVYVLSSDEDEKGYVQSGPDVISLISSDEDEFITPSQNPIRSSGNSLNHICGPHFSPKQDHTSQPRASSLTKTKCESPSVVAATPLPLGTLQPSVLEPPARPSVIAASPDGSNLLSTQTSSRLSPLESSRETHATRVLSDNSHGSNLSFPSGSSNYNKDTAIDRVHIIPSNPGSGNSGRTHQLQLTVNQSERLPTSAHPVSDSDSEPVQSFSKIKKAKQAAKLTPSQRQAQDAEAGFHGKSPLSNTSVPYCGMPLLNMVRKDTWNNNVLSAGNNNTTSEPSINTEAHEPPPPVIQEYSKAENLAPQMSVKPGGLSETAVNDIFKKHVATLHEEHKSLIKNLLQDARKACDIGVKSHASDNASPFAGMKPMQIVEDAKSSFLRKNGQIHQEVFKSGSGRHTNRVIDITAPMTLYRTDAATLPTYYHHSTISENILAENDRNLKYMPYFNDDDDAGGEKNELYIELEQRFRDRMRDRPQRHRVAEKAEKYGLYVMRFLQEIDCDILTIAYFLLDPYPETTATHFGESSRSLWSEKNIYRSTDLDRQRQRLRKIFKLSKPPANDYAAALAVFACKAFCSETGFSIWHVIKKEKAIINILELSQKEEKSKYQGPRVYNDLSCQLCHLSIDCPHHGHFRETIDSDSSSSSPESDDSDVGQSDGSEDSDVVGSDLDNGLSHNIRERVTRSLRPEDASSNTHVTYCVEDVGSSEDFLGMNSDGTITGIYNRAEFGKPAFSDDQLCSDTCFWKKANRRSHSSFEWSEQDRAKFDRIYSVCARTRRGPCWAAMLMRKPCIEVFKMMIYRPNAPRATPKPTKDLRTINRRGWKYWKQLAPLTHIHEDREPFQPCDHEGPCQESNCSCVRAKIVCEKICGCPETCDRRFRGCTCTQFGRTICWQNDHCDCFMLNRECDADLCHQCGAAEIIDGFNQLNDKAIAKKCGNVSMQRGIPKPTLMGHSEIQGWGLYAQEDIKKGEFIGEYKGEIISQTEADRRGAVYHYRGMEYLFKLNKTQEIDSSRAGNKIRFINTVKDSKDDLNCYVRVLFCNLTQRIGLYAGRDIAAGQELFFDYGYPNSVTENFWDKGERRMEFQAAKKVEKAGRKSTKSSSGRRAYYSKNGYSKNGKKIGRPLKKAKLGGGSAPAQRTHPDATTLSSLHLEGLGLSTQSHSHASIRHKRKRSDLDAEAASQQLQDSISTSFGASTNVSLSNLTIRDKITNDNDTHSNYSVPISSPSSPSPTPSSDFDSNSGPINGDNSDNPDDSDNSGEMETTTTGRLRKKNYNPHNKLFGGSVQKRGWITRKKNQAKRQHYHSHSHNDGDGDDDGDDDDMGKGKGEENNKVKRKYIRQKTKEVATLTKTQGEKEKENEWWERPRGYAGRFLPTRSGSE